MADPPKTSLLDIAYAGAKGAWIHITGGPDLTLGECNKIGEMLTEAIDPQATVIWGARIIPEYEGRVEVITIMTGVKSAHIKGPMAEALQAGSKASRDLDESLGIAYLR